MAAYAEHLQAGHFRIQHCVDCRRHVFYPRVICPHCASDRLRWVEPAGTGTVYSTTVVRRSDDKGGPYNVALIDLDEGVRLMSRVERLAPEAVHIGMRVRVHVAQLNGVAAPVFAPIPEGDPA
ncbi:DNA-binding protein [Ferrovibrio terrae]|uniref:DNA-binding protein n=1 Tax=Ferrovibrio terrae TaxID=2594003 RepID=A0A516H185_9PROT|nr:OB-fold domain-containing protein [Ferrovibrio terrae]QDO97553.1 DNA-binding protein [Ferrovibrio terrae]